MTPIAFETMALELDHFERIAVVRNAAWPDHPLAAAELLYDAGVLRQKKDLRCALAVDDGVDVAALWLVHDGRAEHWSVDVMVRPEARTSAVGSALIDEAERMLSDVEVRSLTVTFHDRLLPALNCLADRSFTQVVSEPISILDMRRYEPESFVADEHTELRVETLEALTSDPGWRRTLYEMRLEIDPDQSPDEPFIAQDFETFVARRLGNPLFRAENWLIALDGETWAGLTGIASTTATTGHAQVCFTGVRRPWRRRGLARALKVQVLRQLKERGFRAVVTENADSNPLVSLNARLGFVSGGCWLIWRRGDIHA